MSIRTQITLASVLVVAPLAAGCVMYVVWRPESLLAFTWLASLGIQPAVDFLRSASGGFELPAPLFLYNLPAGLWLFSFVMSLTLIWNRVQPQALTVWLLLPFLMAFGSEIGQLAGVVSGTFDSRDLWVYVFSFAAGMGCTFLFQRRTPQ